MDRYTRYAANVGATLTHSNGDTFEIVDLGSADYHRKLTSDIMPALESIVAIEGMVTLKKVKNADGTENFCAYTCEEGMDEGWGQTLDEALRYMLASALTSWDNFTGFEDY